MSDRGMGDIEQAQRELIEEFSFFDNWVDRYQYIIDMGRKLPEFPADWRTEDKLLKGCQSQVWLHTAPSDGRLDFQPLALDLAAFDQGDLRAADGLSLSPHGRRVAP